MSEWVQYAMIEGMVAKAMPAASSQTTRRGSAMRGRDRSQAVPIVASEPPMRWILPVTAPAWPDVQIVGALQKSGRPPNQAPTPQGAQPAADDHVKGRLLAPQKFERLREARVDLIEHRRRDGRAPARAP